MGLMWATRSSRAALYAFLCTILHPTLEAAVDLGKLTAETASLRSRTASVNRTLPRVHSNST